MRRQPGPNRRTVVLALAVCLLFAALPVASGQDGAPDPTGQGLVAPLAGQEAIDRLGATELPELAARHGLSARELTDLILSDSTLQITSFGEMFHLDPAVEGPGELTAVEPTAPLETTFQLHSKPGAPKTIYLDFNGHTVSNTVWNVPFGSLPNGATALPYDIDGNPGSFSNLELTYIQAIWEIVAEDFAPFDVNVTTQDPGHAAINRSGSGDQIFGTRLVITSSSAAPVCGGCGGVAYVGVANAYGSANYNGVHIPDLHDFYQPAWCFAGSLSGGHFKTVAECASHEIGHNFGLFHDGLQPHSASSGSYYGGHDPWAPIMGLGYDQPVSQWSKGEYLNANNQQDDFAVMGSHGLAIRADDYGNSPGTAHLVSGQQLLTGVISSEHDSDWFTFTAPSAQMATISVTPRTIYGANLDAHLTLYASNGSTVLATSNPPVTRINAVTASGLDAEIQFLTQPGQTYYFRIQGTGHGTGITGYTKYGSVGAYQLWVDLPEFAPNDAFADSILLPGNGGSTWGSNGGATSEGGEAGGSCFSDSQVNSVWWHWTPTISGPAVIDTFLSNFNTNLVVYTGGSVGSLTQVACNVNAGGGNQSQVSFNATAGTTYRIRVDGTNTATGAISLGYRIRTDSDGVGLVNPATGQWFLRDPDSGRTTSFYYGVPGDVPFMGDWNGNGIATPGLYRQSTGFVYLRNSNSTGAANLTFHFGIPGDVPLIGDFNGNGSDTVSVYRPSTGQVFIMNSLPSEGGSPVANISYYFGNPGDKPFAGDFNADGVHTVGLHRETTGLVYFRNSHTQGVADAQFFFGDPGDFIIAGKWIPWSTAHSVGIFRPWLGKFFLRFTNSQGFADREFSYGQGTMRPVYGYFGNMLGSSQPPPGTQ